MQPPRSKSCCLSHGAAGAVGNPAITNHEGDQARTLCAVKGRPGNLDFEEVAIAAMCDVVAWQANKTLVEGLVGVYVRTCRAVAAAAEVAVERVNGVHPVLTQTRCPQPDGDVLVGAGVAVADSDGLVIRVVLKVGGCREVVPISDRSRRTVLDGRELIAHLILRQVSFIDDAGGAHDDDFRVICQNRNRAGEMKDSEHEHQDRENAAFSGFQPSRAPGQLNQKTLSSWIVCD